ncbi:cell division protein FtsL [Streptomyces tateyamensis]|uniref:cell division protein FtsL n=1 Tax=Streptomyces tateyamensis TaxID=565073 RepID=UPI0015E8A00C|nr:cell division protein FtsL [Streptomyces tateyamensis]
MAQVAGKGIQQGRLLPGQLGRARITVRPGRPRGGRGRAPFAILVVLLLTVGLLGLLMLNTSLNDGSIQLAKLRQQTTVLTEQQQQAQQEIDRDAAPDALERAARRLGMVPGGDPAFLQDDGKVLGSPGAAKDSPPVKRSGADLWPGAGSPTPGASAGPPAAAPSAPGSPEPSASPSGDPSGSGPALRVDPVTPSGGASR